MVRLSFRSQQGIKAICDVDPNISAESMMEILVSKHGFPEGAYKFLYSGKVLNDQTPFKDIKENQQIIVFIKQKQNTQTASNPSTTTTQTQQNQQQTPAPKPQPQQPPPQQQQQQRQPTPRPVPQAQQRPPQRPGQQTRPGQPRMPTPEELDRAFNEILTSLHLENIYKPENQFWENPTKVAEVTELINQNPCLLHHIVNSIDKVRVPQVYNPYVINTIFLLLDIQQNDFLPCQSDFDAKYDSLSKNQKTIFDEIRSQYKDKDKDAIMKALEETAFNKDEAIKQLSTQ